MDTWEFLEYVGETLVVVGVLGEVLAEWPDTKNKLAKIFSVVLVAGLAISLAALKQTNEDFNGRMVASNLKASQANERAVEADWQRVQLQNRILDIFGPRQLTEAQSVHIASNLSELKGVKVDVFVYALNGPYTSEDFQDSRNIAMEVTGILRRVGMNAAGWRLNSCLNPGNASNVVVGISGKDGNGGSSPTDDKIAARLIKALAPEVGTFPEVNKYPSPAFLCQHPASDLDPQHPNNRQPDATINIIIGKKIQPILTHEMLEPEARKYPAK